MNFLGAIPKPLFGTPKYSSYSPEVGCPHVKINKVLHKSILKNEREQGKNTTH